MQHLFISSLVATLSYASSCGDSRIPYSLEILPDGQPILGCARPSCFGWAPNGLPATFSGLFFNINGYPDGFIRDGIESIPMYGPDDTRFFRPQTSMCEPFFGSTSCSGVNQWVGGIAPLLNQASYPMLLQCCSYVGLLQTEDLGIASLQGGNMVIGGEVFSSGLQIGFDYISDINNVVRVDGSVQFDVSIRRMPCVDLSHSENTQTAEQNAAQAFQSPQFAPQYHLVPAPPQYTAPVAFYSGGVARWCFTGDMTVSMMDGSTKRMDELRKNDWVLSVNKGTLEYVPVKFWLHRVPTQEAVFNVFETEDGKTIKLTDKHYIFKGDCSRVGSGPIVFKLLPKAAVTADQIRAGDCLFTLGDGRRLHEVRVVRAGKIIQTGIYAPMTSTGRIIVNNVHASCHNVMQANAMGQSVYWVVEKVNEIYDSLFGSDPDEIVETPTGLSTILAMPEMVLPKNLVTF